MSYENSNAVDSIELDDATAARLASAGISRRRFLMAMAGMASLMGLVPGVNYFGRWTTTILAGGSEAWLV